MVHISLQSGVGKSALIDCILRLDGTGGMGGPVSHHPISPATNQVGCD